MAILSRSEYIDQLYDLLADNSTRQISPLDLRTSFVDLVDSLGNLVEGSTLNADNFSTKEIRTTIGGDKALEKINLVGRSSSDNSAFGYSALSANYNGVENTAIGAFSLSCNLYGEGNTAVGFNSCGGNITGSGNTSIGSYSLSLNKRGDHNISIGYGAGWGATETEGYKFYLGVHPQASGGCDTIASGNTTPLLYGDLATRQLGVSVNSFVSDEGIRVSGDIIPSITEKFSLGRSNYKWDGYFQDLHVCNLYYDCDPDIIEGFMTEQVEAPSGYCYPTSGILRVKNVTASGELDGGSCSDGYDEMIINRDTTLGISGCQYVIAHKINYEYRPIWVGCSGFCDDL